MLFGESESRVDHGWGTAEVHLRSGEVRFVVVDDVGDVPADDGDAGAVLDGVQAGDGGDQCGVEHR